MISKLINYKVSGNKIISNGLQIGFKTGRGLWRHSSPFFMLPDADTPEELVQDKILGQYDRGLPKKKLDSSDYILFKKMLRPELTLHRKSPYEIQILDEITIIATIKSYQNGYLLTRYDEPYVSTVFNVEKDMPQL